VGLIETLRKKEEEEKREDTKRKLLQKQSRSHTGRKEKVEMAKKRSSENYYMIAVVNIIKEMVRNISIRMVDHPDQVCVYWVGSYMRPEIIIEAHPNDIGILIGTRGLHVDNMTETLRPVAVAQAKKRGCRFTPDFWIHVKKEDED
jgi:predicted RNA-binding protein YlqC (UPF0109 family)